MDLDKICRMCCARKTHLKSIFIDYAEHNLVQIIVDILHLEIHQGDGLPPNVCATCANSLFKLRDSISSFRENDKTIRRMVLENGRNVERFTIAPKDSVANYAPFLAGPQGLFDVKVELATESEVRQNDFKCYICQSAPMDSTHTLLQHLSNHTKLLPYKCSECKTGHVILQDVQSLNDHRKMHALPMKCDYCYQGFSDVAALLLHLKTFHLPENASCLTSTVAPEEKSLENWQDQYTVTHGPNEEVYTCKLCGKTFSNLRSVKYHVKNHNKNIKCDRCDLRFVSESKLRTHYAVHTGIRQHKCEICEKEFLWKNNLTQHLKLHSNERNFSCEFCGKLFTYREGMKSHVRFNHLSESPYECIMCRQKFVDSASLARHVAAEHQPTM